MFLLALVSLVRCRPLPQEEVSISPPVELERIAPQTWERPAVVEPAQTPVLSLALRLVDREDWSPQSKLDFDAEGYPLIPGPDADWPDLESAELLQELLVDGLGEEDVPLIGDFLAAAAREGLLDGDPSDLDDPWVALISLWASYVDRISAEEELDEDDMQWLAEQTLSVTEAHPEGEPTEALRYCLVLMVGWFEVDVDVDWKETLIDLADSDDDVLARQATEDLLYADGVTAADYERMATPTAEIDRVVALSGLRQAVREGDWMAVEMWAQRLEETPDVTDTDLLTIDEVRGLLSASGAALPEDWRAELIAAVHVCDARAPVVGEYRLTWSVDSGTWDYSGALNGPLELCLEHWSPSTAGPQRAVVELDVVGAVIK